MNAGTLKVIKKNKNFEFTNSGTLKLPIEEIYHHGRNSKSRNSRMQIMLRMVGFLETVFGSCKFLCWRYISSHMDRKQKSQEERAQQYLEGVRQEENVSEQELQSVKEQIHTLENSKLESEEMNRFIAEIQKEIDYMNKFARPKFIRYYKIYIDIKKAHAKELRTTGHIQCNRVE